MSAAPAYQARDRHFVRRSYVRALEPSRPSVWRMPAPRARPPAHPRSLRTRLLTSFVTLKHRREQHFPQHRSAMGDCRIWSHRLESVPLAVGIDALAAAIGPGGGGEVERPSTGPPAWRALRATTVPAVWPGQPPRAHLASPGACRARPSTRTVGLASGAKAGRGHSRPQDG